MDSLEDNTSEKDTVKHTYGSDKYSEKDSLDDSLRSDTDTVKANPQLKKTFESPQNLLRKLTSNDKRSHYRVKSWSKELGSNIQSQTDFTFGEKLEREGSGFNSTYDRYLSRSLRSNRLKGIGNRKRLNSFTHEMVEEMPLEHTNGRLETFTNSEKDSGLNKIELDHQEVVKLNDMPQFYANDEETQLIISDLESYESVYRAKHKGSSRENSVKDMKPESQEMPNKLPFRSMQILKQAMQQIRNPRQSQNLSELRNVPERVFQEQPLR